MSSPAPDAPSAAPTLEPTPSQALPAPRVRTPRAWLIAFAALAAVLLVSVIVLALVVSPPSYEPVPIPSVSRT